MKSEKLKKKYSNVSYNRVRLSKSAVFQVICCAVIIIHFIGKVEGAIPFGPYDEPVLSLYFQHNYTVQPVPEDGHHGAWQLPLPWPDLSGRHIHVQSLEDLGVNLRESSIATPPGSHHLRTSGTNASSRLSTVPQLSDLVNTDTNASSQQSAVTQLPDSASLNDGHLNGGATGFTPALQTTDYQVLTCMDCNRWLVDTIFLPCGHLVMCSVCATRHTKCPICRKKISGTMHRSQ